MGCERFRDGGLGVGGVRASMERRWLINAKTTVMRQRKWQEVKMKKEEEEMKKVAAILEKRKRERARLAAYIHMQPTKCPPTSTWKSARYANKRFTWNTCLMEDQKLILRLREKSAVAHNSYSQKANHAANILWQGGDVQQSDASTDSYKQANHYCYQQYQMSARYLGDAAYEVENTQERDRHDSDQMSEFSATKDSIRSEPVRTTSWVSDVPTYASLAEDSRSQRIPKVRSPSPMKVVQVANQHFDNPFGAPPRKGCPQLKSKLSESYTEPYSGASHSAALGQRDSNRQVNCDLREEILKARQANEAATARLIAEVTAIESRLEDCSLQLEPLDFTEAEGSKGTIGVDGELHMDEIKVNDDADFSQSCGETDSNYSTDSESDHSEVLPKRPTDSNANYNGQGFPNSEGSQPNARAINTSRVAGPVNPQSSTSIDWNSVTVGSTEAYTEMRRRNLEIEGQERAKLEELNTLHHASGKSAVHVNSELSTDIKWFVLPSDGPESQPKTVANSFQATREACTHHKEGVAVFDGENDRPSNAHKLEPGSSTNKENCKVWEIEWDVPPPERWLNKKEESCQRKQHISPPRIFERGEWRLQAKQNSVSLQVGDHLSLREERKKFESISRGTNTQSGQSGGNTHPKVDLPPLPLHHLNFGTSQLVYRGCMGTQPPQSRSPYTNDNTMLQSSRTAGSTRKVDHDTSGDKENFQRSQSGALTQEEEKIFASLERLDWKLAALHTRSASTGRDLLASQGEFSTKSAPAVMGPPTKQLYHGAMPGVKKPIPYSTVPARPLTPQSHRPPTGLRRRRQVGLTNKNTGKVSHNCPRYLAGTSKNNSGQMEPDTEKWQFPSGNIVYHQSVRQLFDAVSAC